VIKKYFPLYFMLAILIFLLQNCQTENKKKPDDKNVNSQNVLTETFRKTGWITENQYRVVVFIITNEECEHSSQSEIEEKIKFEAYKNLQKDLSPSFNRNASTRIKLLTDSYGKLIKADKGCVDGNVYFYDLEKNDLKVEFEKIKNLK